MTTVLQGDDKHGKGEAEEEEEYHVEEAAAAAEEEQAFLGEATAFRTRPRNFAAPPPRLLLDDGSRVMMENGARHKNDNSHQMDSTTRPRRPPHVSLVEFYEVDRLATTIVQQMEARATRHNHDNDDDFGCRVALQFSSHLLADGPEVSWLLEDAIVQKATHQNPPLIFLLGDSTGSPCCPNEVGAAHLQADVLVQFGSNACLSPPDDIPVLYALCSLHQSEEEETTAMSSCAEALLHQCRQDQKEQSPRKLLLLFDLDYYTSWHSPLEQILRSSDAEQRLWEEILVGRAPQTSIANQETKEDDCIILGGLRLPPSVQRLSDYTCIYIGSTNDPDDASKLSNHLLHTFLHWSSECHATSTPADSASLLGCFWSYNVPTHTLDTAVESSLTVSRLLRRRFYLTQKARLASTIGILVATLSQARRFPAVVRALQAQIRAAGKTGYLLAVGKVNPAKCANVSPPVEAWVIVSCPQTCILPDERDFAVPLLTPWELSVALGNAEWGPGAYGRGSFHSFPPLENNEWQPTNETQDNDNDEEDRPFFSIVSGTYVSSASTVPSSNVEKEEEEDAKKTLAIATTEQRLTTYHSAAAEHWKQREYKGLESQIGETPVQPAVPGRVGIASDYGNL